MKYKLGDICLCLRVVSVNGDDLSTTETFKRFINKPVRIVFKYPKPTSKHIYNFRVELLDKSRTANVLTQDLVPFPNNKKIRRAAIDLISI